VAVHETCPPWGLWLYVGVVFIGAGVLVGRA